MLFGIWQFKITVYVLLLASSLGQKLIRTCNREYCYKTSTEGGYGTNIQIDWQRFSSENRGDSRELIKHIRDDNPSEDRIARIIDNEDRRVDRESRRDFQLGEEVHRKDSRRIENVSDERQQRKENSRRVDENNIRQEERESRHYISRQENRESRYEDINLNQNRYDNGREARRDSRNDDRKVEPEKQREESRRTLERIESENPKSIRENSERQKERCEISRRFNNARFYRNVEPTRENRQQQVEQREISRRSDDDASIERTDSKRSENSMERRDESRRDSVKAYADSHERNRRVGERTDLREIVNKIDTREESRRAVESNERQRVQQRQEKSSEVSRGFDNSRALRSESRTNREERLTDWHSSRLDSTEEAERREVNRRVEDSVRSAETIRSDRQLNGRQAQRQEFRQNKNKQVERRPIPERLDYRVFGNQETIRIEGREASRFVGRQLDQRREVNKRSYEREARENARRLDGNFENARRNDMRRTEQHSETFEHSQERKNIQSAIRIGERESRRVRDTSVNRDLNRRSDKLAARQIADHRNINHFSEKAEYRTQLSRRIAEHIYQRQNVRSQEDIVLRKEETLEDGRSSNTQLEREHRETVRRFDERELQYEISRRLEQERKSRPADLLGSDKHYLYRERESRQRREEDRRETTMRLNQRKPQQNTEERSGGDMGDYQGERVENNRDIEKRRESARRFEDREPQREITRRVEAEHGSRRVDLLRSEERDLQRIRESRQRRAENKLNHRDRREIKLSFNKRESQRNIELRSEDKLESRRVDLLQESQRNSELRQHRDETTRHFDVRENLQRRSEDEHESGVRDETTRRLGERGFLRGISRRSENDYTENRFDINPFNESKRKVMEHREVLRRLDEYRNSNEEKSLQHGDEINKLSRRSNERIAHKDESEARIQDTRRSESFKHQRENSKYRIEYRFIEDDYAEKPSVLFKKGYFAMGQGIILAFVIMKTLNGKDELKHKIPQNFREAFGIIGI